MIMVMCAQVSRIGRGGYNDIYCYKSLGVMKTWSTSSIMDMWLRKLMELPLPSHVWREECWMDQAWSTVMEADGVVPLHNV